ncbi:hypothetical protein [Thalassotalea agariperforans]
MPKLDRESPITGTLLDSFDLSGVEYNKATENFTVHSLITNGAIFQQEKEIRFAGIATPKNLIAVELKNDINQQEVLTYTRVPESGEWLITLPSQKASFDTYTLTISNGQFQSRIKNILIGEVWLVAGQ